MLNRYIVILKNQTEYPHPVLYKGNDDYIDSSFDIELVSDPVIEGNNALISIIYKLKCDGLNQLILEKKAKVVVYLESVIAEYRNVFQFANGQDTIEIIINKDQINRTLTLKGYIIATESIPSFILSEQNRELLGTAPSTIRTGDVLAISANSYVIPLESYDPLADRPSIFSIRKQIEHPNEEVSADFSGNKITIWLNEETHNKYRILYEAPDVRGVLASFFAIPVLVDALTYIKNMSEEDLIVAKEKKWYQVISYRLNELKIDISSEESLTKIANIILPRVFSSSIDSLTQLCNALLKGGEKDEN